MAIVLNVKNSLFLLTLLHLILISVGRKQVRRPTIPEKTAESISVAATNAQVLEQKIMLEGQSTLYIEGDDDNEISRVPEGMDLRHGVYSGDSPIVVESSESTGRPVKIVPSTGSNNGGLKLLRYEASDDGMMTYFFDETVDQLDDPIYHSAPAPVAAIVYRPPPRMNDGTAVHVVTTTEGTGVAEGEEDDSEEESEEEEEATTQVPTTKPSRSWWFAKHSYKAKAATRAPPRRPRTTPKPVTQAPTTTTTTTMKPKREETLISIPSHNQVQGRSLQNGANKRCRIMGESCRRHGECCQNYCNWLNMKCSNSKRGHYWD